MIKVIKRLKIDVMKLQEKLEVPLQILVEAAVTAIASMVTCTLFEVDEFPPDVVLQV